MTSGGAGWYKDKTNWPKVSSEQGEGGTLLGSLRLQPRPDWMEVVWGPSCLAINMATSEGLGSRSDAVRSAWRPSRAVGGLLSVVWVELGHSRAGPTVESKNVRLAG